MTHNDPVEPEPSILDNEAISKMLEEDPGGFARFLAKEKAQKKAEGEKSVVVPHIPIDL